MKRMIVAGALAALAMSGGTSSALANSDLAGAERLRRLDIMLQVGAQRCAGGAQDYAKDYRRFAASHRRDLKAAEAELREDLALRHGDGADRELERRGTALANTYGQGHPWLGCAQLGLVTRNLTQVLGRPTLEEAADQLTRQPATMRIAAAH